MASLSFAMLKVFYFNFSNIGQLRCCWDSHILRVRDSIISYFRLICISHNSDLCESECLRFGTTNILFEVWVSETYALWVYDFPNFEVDNFRKKYEFWHSELLRFTNFKGPNFCDLRSLRFRISEIQNVEITNWDSVEKCFANVPVHCRQKTDG